MVASISRKFTNFIVAYITYEEDDDEDLFYQVLHFHMKLCSFLTSFTGRLYASCDATSYNINDLFVSLKCQNDTFRLSCRYG